MRKTIEKARHVSEQKDTIEVTFEDGSRIFVPTDMRNKDYRALLESDVKIQEPNK